MVMKKFAGRNIYLLIAIPIFLVLLLCEFVFFRENNHNQESGRIYELFEKKEKQLRELIDTVDIRLIKNVGALTDWSLLQLFNQKEEEIALTISKANVLIFWSSSLVAFPSEENSDTISEGLIHLPTGW